MKSFKQFTKSLNETAKDIVQGAIINGTPSAVVFHGGHSVDKNIDQGTMVDGVPCAVVFHGGHSRIMSEPLDKTRTLKEYKEDSEEYFEKHDNAHIHSNPECVGKVLSHNQVREGMDHHHINKYTGGSRVLNEALYDAHAKCEPAPKVVHSFNGTEHDVKGLDKAISRNKLAKDTHLYSGVGFEPSKMASSHPEGHVHLPAYTSTSINKSVARNFAALQGVDKKTTLRHSGLHGHILHIHAKAGQHATYIENESQYKGEHEVLLPRATTLKIHGYSDHEDSYGDVYRVHHATIVDHKK